MTLEAMKIYVDAKSIATHPKTEKLKKRFSFSGAKLWNFLPTDLRNADTLSDFKKGLCALKL